VHFWKGVCTVSEFLTGFLLIKIGAAVLMVVLLTVLAEVASPRFAGILSGYPLGAAISLFFMGHDISPEFAAQSALYTSVGLVATQVFAYFYYRFSLLSKGLHKSLQIPCSSLGGVAGYFVAALLLRLLDVDAVMAVMLPAVAILFFIYLFRDVENARIEKRANSGLPSLMVKAAAAGGVIVFITSVAGTVGAGWAGLFTAFPITILPSVVIIHATYDPEHARAFLKNVPKGLGSIIVYAMALRFFYPSHGIYLGTVLSYVFATVYLVAVQLKESSHLKSAFGRWYSASTRVK
jgi:uncharacterized membrane protein (GlpM family)